MNDTLEIIDLENLIQDEVKCQYNHNKETCSIEVTHVATDCQSALMVCHTAVHGKIEGVYVLRELFHCSRCLRHARECWDVRPI